MVERARLESVCMRKCTEGSNPSLSANRKITRWVFFFIGRMMVNPSRGFDKIGRTEYFAHDVRE